jgi:hypothetical protein
MWRLQEQCVPECWFILNTWHGLHPKAKVINLLNFFPTLCKKASNLMFVTCIEHLHTEGSETGCISNDIKYISLSSWVFTSYHVHCQHIFSNIEMPLSISFYCQNDFSLLCLSHILMLWCRLLRIIFWTKNACVILFDIATWSTDSNWLLNIQKVQYGLV